MRVIPDDVHGALAVYAEARGESFTGQLAVANVIRERMRLKYASDGTVVGTVWRPMQFSWTNSGDPQRGQVLAVDDTNPGWKVAKRAWKQSKDHTVLPPHTVLYHSDAVKPYWAKAKTVKFVRAIGHHLFYTDEDAVKP